MKPVNRPFSIASKSGWWNPMVRGLFLRGSMVVAVAISGSCLTWVPGREAVAEEAGAGAAVAEESTELKLAGGQWTLQVPKEWEVGRPRVTMVEHEVKVPRAEGDSADGRMTMMAAGGSIQANIDRWVAQFKNPQGPKVDKIKVGDAEVQVVELSGTFLERAGGPVTPPTDRPNYRLLGAIIPLGDNGNYFLKLTGPDKTIADNAAAFRKAVEGLKKGR
ncbi:MAG: hypothetical protein U0795_26700 [Pirellulales bacterium]